jgi:spore germination protein GerM
MKKEIWILIVLGVIIVVLAGMLFFVLFKTKPLPAELGITVSSLERQDDSFADIKIKGYINGGNWIAFEGQAGVVNFLDKDNKSLGYVPLEVVGDWMVPPPINFEASIRMTLQGADSVESLKFTNENPSGDPVRDKIFILPGKLVKSVSETMKVLAYFGNNEMDPEVSCNKVFTVERDVLKTTAVARAALDELLKGLTSNEQAAGFFTSINTGVKIQGLTIENGIARVDFNEQLEYQVGGSCKVSAIRAQITQTLKQFLTVKNVVISINGRTEDILQP